MIFAIRFLFSHAQSKLLSAVKISVAYAFHVQVIRYSHGGHGILRGILVFHRGLDKSMNIAVIRTSLQ